jgi:hypothetical protein
MPQLVTKTYLRDGEMHRLLLERNAAGGLNITVEVAEVDLEDGAPVALRQIVLGGEDLTEAQRGALQRVFTELNRRVRKARYT